MSPGHVLQMLDRTRTGPLCTSNDWNYKVLPRTVPEKLEQNGLKKTFDKENPVNTDDELADSFYQAGYELALELGILCQDAERIIKVSGGDLKAP